MCEVDRTGEAVRIKQLGYLKKLRWILDDPLNRMIFAANCDLELRDFMWEQG